MHIQKLAALVAAPAYITAFALGVAAFLNRSHPLRLWSRVLLATGLAGTLIGLVVHCLTRGEIPGSSSFSFFSLYVLITLGAGQIAVWRTGMGDLAFAFQLIPVLAALPLPLLPEETMVRAKEPSALLFLHLLMVLLSLSSFTLAVCSGALLYWQDLSIKRKRTSAFSEQLPPLDQLDRATFLHLGLGFVFLTIGVILGFLSAGPEVQQDPSQRVKVVLGVTAWCIYAYYLRNRVALGWRGRTQSLFALAGFLVAVAVSLLAMLWPR